jgi:N-acetylglucosamine kinase-like BadF-type ATPase
VISRALSVDLGATWMRLYLRDGGRRRFFRRRAVPWRQAAAALRRLKLGPLDEIVVAPTRVFLRRDRLALARSLRGLARKVEVISDYELAHRVAFAGGPGVVVIGGTGSVAFGKNAKGKKARAGGLGPYLGDEGSGFWIGKRGLTDPKLSRRFPKGLALKLAHDAEQVRSVAALAPKVLRWAKDGVPAAKKIRAEGASALAGIALECAKKLGLKKDAIAVHGSLFNDAGFEKEFRKALR